MNWFVLTFVVLVSCLYAVIISAEDNYVLSNFEKTLSSSKKLLSSTPKATVSSQSKKTAVKSTHIDVSKVEVASSNTKLSFFPDGFVGRTFYAPNADANCMSPFMARFERLNVCKPEDEDNGFGAYSIGSQVTWSKKYDNYTVNVLFYHYESRNCEWINDVDAMGIPGIDLCPATADNNNDRVSYHYFDSSNLYRDFVPTAPGVVYSRYASKGGCEKKKLNDLVTLNYFASEVCRNDNDGNGYYKITCDANQAPIMELYGTDATCTNRLSFETAPPACGSKREPATYVCVPGGSSVAPMAQQALRGGMQQDN